MRGKQVKPVIILNITSYAPFYEEVEAVLQSLNQMRQALKCGMKYLQLLNNIVSKN